MSKNDQIILEQIIEQERQERFSSHSKSEFFEIFVAEQMLKEYDLSHDELEIGLTGNGGDGGIDAMYTIINGEMAQEDTDTSSVRKNVVIDVIVIQAKTSSNFKEEAVDKIKATLEEALDLSNDIDKLKQTYNPGLVSAIGIFRKTYRDLVSKFPSLNFRIIYASTGDGVHPNVSRKAEKLKQKIHKLFSESNITFSFVNATELLKLARRQPTSSYQIALAEIPITSSGDVGYVCLARIYEYYRFIKDEKNQLRRNLFESNVRDYQGSTAVNSEISEFLRGEIDEEFWWMNNGITILASKATTSGKTLTLEDPQIVNGLQTSTEIFRYFNDTNNEKDERNVLVRVIVPTKPESRDKIIKATNSQTNIPPASLRATDKIHRDIEDYLRQLDLFYDRRKNHHKNERKPLEKIIGISLMAQSIMSIILQKPDSARARPSSLLKDNTRYSQIFSENYPIKVYGVCASLVKMVDSELRQDGSMDTRERNNLKFYIAMYTSSMLTKCAKPSVEQISKISIEDSTKKTISEAKEIVKTLYYKLGGDDQIAKGPLLTDHLKKRLAKEFEPRQARRSSKES